MARLAYSSRQFKSTRPIESMEEKQKTNVESDKYDKMFERLIKQVNGKEEESKSFRFLKEALKRCLRRR